MDGTTTNDYSQQLSRIAAALEAIVASLAAIQANQSTLVQHAITDELGLVARPHDAALNRAITVNALRQSGQLDIVGEEMANPTDIGAA
ncbi:hypothetical protein [Stutzerimonas kunmingensis]|uniref:hypothetical protein n=1 Tax=Stutzerimonas kunmingensis TaxID=1211807 RepID=UPI0028A9A934|nr:hypothetical protein [Stutzerimonas kunmingensis]